VVKEERGGEEGLLSRVIPVIGRGHKVIGLLRDGCHYFT